MLKFTQKSIFLFFFISIFMPNVHADILVETQGDGAEDREIYAGDTSTTSDQVRLIVDYPSSGNGHTESSPVIVYMPYDSNSGQIERFYNVYSENLNNSTNIPHNLGSSITGTLRLQLRITNTDATTYYLGVAVKEDDQYVNIQTSGIGISSTSKAGASFSFSFSDFCDDVDNVCDELNDASDTNEGDINFYFYLSTTDPSTRSTGSDTITTDEFGLFVNLFYSNKIPENSLSQSGLSRLDSQLLASYTGGNLITQMSSLGHKTVAFSANSSCALDSNISDIFSDTLGVFNYAEDGEVRITELTNGTTYTISIVNINKYQFASGTSNCESETPEAIIPFLEDQNCYLISAGFGKNHPVLDAYRFFRDKLLLRIPLGQVLTSLYYKSAPKYAIYIYNRPWLRALVRFASIGLLVLAGTLSAVVFAFAFVSLRKRRILNGNSEHF